MSTTQSYSNPFRPGNGQQPLYLAGRTHEQEDFERMLKQRPVSQNLVLTGLRGVGKTVLLNELKPIAQKSNWLWAGNDLSESASLTGERIAKRIVTDLASLLGPLLIQQEPTNKTIGFLAAELSSTRPLNFDDLWKIYDQTGGLVEDKLKAVMTIVADIIGHTNLNGIIFAYDEAQNLSDHKANHEFPLSLLLDVFSYFQRLNNKCSFMLVLCGLPTLLPKLNEARTYTERMFHIMRLQGLDDVAAREAILRPIEISQSKLKFSDPVISDIVKMSGGYPYFIQFVCKEVFDAWIVKAKDGLVPTVAKTEIMRKLDEDFFAGRWLRATDRQQDFLKVIASLTNSEDEFSVSDIVEASQKILKKGFTPSHATQILLALADKGLVYKSRRGNYMLAVPLMSQFIRRQLQT
jgi:AAA ATPase domain